MALQLSPVPYDPALVEGMRAFQNLVEPEPMTKATISAHRAHFATVIPPIEEQVRGRDVTWEDRTVPGPAGAPDIEVTIIRPRERARRSPAVLGIHGGGMVVGTRLFSTPELIGFAERHGTVGIAVEYRLAPEHPGPAQAEDCYAALLWMVSHAAELDIDPRRILVSGASAGGGLSAAVALMTRDRKGPELVGQLLGYPMLDDRNVTASSHQYVDGIGPWDRSHNETAWEAIRGDEPQVSPYTAPTRAADLSGLAPAFVEVGAAEVFRDEAVEYASRIWRAGGQAELHVWSGGYHGFSSSSPEALVSRAADAARESWLRRILHPATD